MVFKMAANSIKMLISEGNLIHNIKHLENKYEKKILPVLKANAYGHDIGMVSEILYNNGYREFAVARLNEAEKILENKKITESRILVFESIGIEFLDIIKNSSSMAGRYQPSPLSRHHLKAGKSSHERLFAAMYCATFSMFATPSVRLSAPARRRSGLRNSLQ